MAPNKENKVTKERDRMMAWCKRIDHFFDRVKEPDKPITPEEKATTYAVVIVLGLVILLVIVLGSIALVETRQVHYEAGSTFGI
jgi:preprotein translocase subunit SecE